MSRDRRRLYAGRFAHNAPLEGRRVWDIGDWGNASGLIGRRWEAVGTMLVRRASAEGRLPAPASAAVISFLDDPILQRRLATVGLTNADVLLVYPDGNSLVAAPVDFKWSIETANEKQVGALALEALFERIPDELNACIRAHVGHFAGPEMVFRDGFFFAPQSRSNEKVWRARSAREAPFDAVFVPVDSTEFFGHLPGWRAAEQLADLDRRTKHLDLLDWADHYFRLGVGVSAARALLERSIFDTVGEIAADELPDLPLAEWAHRDSASLIAWLSPQVEERKALARRLREVLRLPYSLRDLLRDFARWNAPAPDPNVPAPIPAELREEWEPLHRELANRHRAAVLAEGRRQVAAGSTEVEALDLLGRRRGVYQQRARKWATELVAARA